MATRQRKHNAARSTGAIELSIVVYRVPMIKYKLGGFADRESLSLVVVEQQIICSIESLRLNTRHPNQRILFSVPTNRLSILLECSAKRAGSGLQPRRWHCVFFFCGRRDELIQNRAGVCAPVE